MQTSAKVNNGAQDSDNNPDEILQDFLSKYSLQHVSPTTVKSLINKAVQCLVGENVKLLTKIEKLEEEKTRMLSDIQDSSGSLDSKLKEEEEKTKKLSIQLENAKNKHEMLMNENKKIILDRETKMGKLQNELSNIQKELESKGRDNVKLKKDLDNLKNELTAKESSLAAAQKRIEEMKEKKPPPPPPITTKQPATLASSKKNFIEFETLHEIELLKNAKEDWLREKRDLEKKYSNLNQEAGDLQRKIEEQANELRNEKKRHYLLTRQYNSLMEENNKLKQKLGLKLVSNNQHRQHENGRLSARQDRSINTISPHTVFRSKTEIIGINGSKPIGLDGERISGKKLVDRPSSSKISVPSNGFPQLTSKSKEKIG